MPSVVRRACPTFALYSASLSKLRLLLNISAVKHFFPRGAFLAGKNCFFCFLPFFLLTKTKISFILKKKRRMRAFALFVKKEIRHLLGAYSPNYSRVSFFCQYLFSATPRPPILAGAKLWMHFIFRQNTEL